MAQTNSIFRRMLLGTGLVLACLNASQARAHALPGTTITLTPSQTALRVVVQIPLNELSLAFPQGQLDGITVLSTQQKDLLLTYLREHIAFTPRGAAALPIPAANMELREATHENIGLYQVLDVTMSLPVPAQTDLFPLQLCFDGVIHKVRNHDAEVFLVLPSGGKRSLERVTPNRVCNPRR